MIDDKFKRDLAARMANAITQTIVTSINAKHLKKQMSILERLFQDNQISLAVAIEGYEAVCANSSVSIETFEYATSRLEKLKPLGITKESKPVLAQHNANSFTSDFRLIKKSVSFQQSNYDLSESGYDFYDVNLNSAWLPLSNNLEQFLIQIGPIDNILRVSPKTTEIHICPLPWYTDVYLLRVHDENWQHNEIVIYYLLTEEKLLRLNGKSPPIHEINATVKFDLQQEHSLSYLKYFCFFVHGEEGAFYIADDINDSFLSSIDNEADLAVLNEYISPISFEGINEQGHYLYNAVVYYSNALFRAEFAVHRTGMVEMLDDEPLATLQSVVPVKVEGF